MRVLLVNTSEHTGGASIAAARLLEALNDNGIKAKLLVSRKVSERPTVTALPSYAAHRAHFLTERLAVWAACGFRRDHLFDIDPALCGTDITTLPEFREADVVHLHWVNQGFLSLRGVRRILRSGKPLVWTLHDMWPFTGVCHYARECQKWRTGCHHCELLPGGGGRRDLSARTFGRKSSVYAAGRMAFVACSHWLADLAAVSPLLAGHKLYSIPNPIDTGRFCPADRSEVRRRLGLPEDRQLILFVAYKVTSPLKGVDYLCDALQRLVAARPELRQQWQLVAVGRESGRLTDRVPVPVTAIDYVSEEEQIIDLYRAADVLAMPSLHDNLPNTIAEGMACGLPCVGFNVGGLPQMITHRVNGYLATYRDADDFGRGLLDTLQPEHHAQRSLEARRTAVTAYAQRAVAARYTAVYEEMIALAKSQIPHNR